MNELFTIAENEMISLKQPYVGTEHLLLAYLKQYPSKIISYDTFKKYIIEIIGSSYKESPYILYTPILRKIKNNNKSIKESLKDLLSNQDSIAYNILVSQNINIEALYNEINTNT